MSAPKPTPCRFCDVPIVWAKNEKTNKPMPFDAEPDESLEKGWELFMRGDEALARYERLRMHGQRLRRVHFETCTDYDPSTKRAKADSKPTQQQDMVGRDRVAEVRDAMPPGYIAMYGR